MSLFRKEIDQVFTPRRPEVNPKMYIARPQLEEDLENALAGALHILIHGDSGCGKSWLYRRVMEKHSIQFALANLANASRLGGITKELENLIARDQKPVNTGYDETKKTEGSVGLPGAIGAKGGLEHSRSYEIPQLDPLEAFLKKLRSDAGSGQACLVLDNLEAIFGDKKLMKELGDIITLLDDPAYSKYKVKFILVGVPADVLAYFTHVQNRQTVSNRIYELREVGPMGREQADELIRKGFVDELHTTFEDDQLKYVQDHIAWITLGVPQFLHEYCRELALLCKADGWRFRPEFIAEADKRWLRSSLSKNYAAVSELMNERETSAGRRNQVLFCLGKVQTDTFRHSDIEELLRTEFKLSTVGVTLNVPAVLAEIAKGDNPPIKRTPKGDSYRFVEPRFRMCIRLMLVKNDERVSRLDFSKL